MIYCAGGSSEPNELTKMKFVQN